MKFSKYVSALIVLVAFMLGGCQGGNECKFYLKEVCQVCGMPQNDIRYLMELEKIETALEPYRYAQVKKCIDGVYKRSNTDNSNTDKQKRSNELHACFSSVKNLDPQVRDKFIQLIVEKKISRFSPEAERELERKWVKCRNDIINKNSKNDNNKLPSKDVILIQNNQTAISTAKLCNINKKLVVPIGQASCPLYERLEQYYSSANNHIISFLTDKAQNRPPALSNKIRILYLFGEAGVGKSFLVKMIRNTDNCLIKLKDKFAEDQRFKQQYAVKGIDDLKAFNIKHSFNTLLGFSQPDHFSQNKLRDLLISSACMSPERIKEKIKPLVIIDDLDEIHAKSATAFLKQLEKFVNRENEKISSYSADIVVLGRGEAFVSLFNSAKRELNRQYVAVMQVRGLRFCSIKDLELVARNAISYAKGNYTNPGTEEEINQFLKFVKHYPYLNYSIQNLSFTRSLSLAATNKVQLDNYKLREYLFNRALDRNHETHGRPKYDSGNNYEIYKALLEKVAVKYINQVDKDGWFLVHNKDSVFIHYRNNDETKTIKVRVRNLLNRSGLVSIDPLHAASRYRMSPFWFHIYLVDEFNKRHGHKLSARCLDARMP